MVSQPSEEAALKTAASLHEPVEGLVEDPGESIASIVVGWFSGGGVAVDGFVVFELTLQVGGG